MKPEKNSDEPGFTTMLRTPIDPLIVSPDDIVEEPLPSTAVRPPLSPESNCQLDDDYPQLHSPAIDAVHPTSPEQGRSFQSSRSSSNGGGSVDSIRANHIPLQRMIPSPTRNARSRRERRSNSNVDAAPNYEIPLKGQTKAWKNCMKALKEHDHALVKGWKEDIDTLLVFAGLFSAVLTAFIVESYKFLQNSPSSGSDGPSEPADVAVRINTLWFSSLVFSLAAASIGILVKQWLRDFVSSAASSPRENARIREFRHQGLKRWHIPEIIAFLPILLQIALAFFFVGLLDLLWSLNRIVAGVVSCFVIASLLFLVVTTVLPTIWADSPHRSPQALGIYLVVQGAVRMAVSVFMVFAGPLGFYRRPWPIYVDVSLFRSRWRRIRSWVSQFVHGHGYRNWREREKDLVRTREADLDHQILAGADALLMDDKFLEEVVRPCISQTECQAAVNCLLDILAHRAHGTIDGLPSWKHSDIVDKGIATLLHLTADVLARIDLADEAGTLKMLHILDKLCRAMPFELDHPTVEELYQRVYVILANFLNRGEQISRAAFNLMYALCPRAGDNVRLNTIVIECVISYARSARDRYDSHLFFDACGMALKFSNNLDYIELRLLRNQIERLLDILEGYLGQTNFNPSPSLLVAVLDVADKDPTLVASQLIRKLNHKVSGVSNGPRGGLPADLQADFASRRAHESLRRMYSHKKKPQRRDAVRPVERLDELGLSLPDLLEEPETTHPNHVA